MRAAPPTFLSVSPVRRAAWELVAPGYGRAGDEDGLVHVVDAALALHAAGEDDELVAAGLLHDAIEDGVVTELELRARLGDRVGAIVAALTEDAAVEDYEARKTALRQAVALGGADVARVYAADKLAKAREMRTRARGRGRPPARDARIAHHLASLELLERLAGDHVLVRALRPELELALEGCPAPGSA